VHPVGAETAEMARHLGTELVATGRTHVAPACICMDFLNPWTCLGGLHMQNSQFMSPMFILCQSGDRITVVACQAHHDDQSCVTYVICLHLLGFTAFQALCVKTHDKIVLEFCCVCLSYDMM
jgi:hypothetical protein